MQPRAPVSFLSFLGPEGRPQNGGFFHLIDKIADFLHNKLFFLIAPRDLHFLGPLGSIFSAPEHVQHLFSLWECSKMGFFP